MIVPVMTVISMLVSIVMTTSVVPAIVSAMMSATVMTVSVVTLAGIGFRRTWFGRSVTNGRLGPRSRFWCSHSWFRTRFNHAGTWFAVSNTRVKGFD